MSRAATILRNVASNWVGVAVSAAVTLLLTPFVLHQLGEARYGAWVLVGSIVGFYGLLDLGFSGGINQYLTRYLAARDYEKASECISTALALLSIAGAVCVVLTVGAAYVAPHMWNFPPSVEREAFWCILIVGLTSSVQFVFFPFMAVFTATQRFDLSNLIGVSTRLLMAGSVYAALDMGYGLIGISAATCGATLVDYLIRWRVARRLVPQIEVKARLANRARLREMVSFGSWSFVISISGFIYAHAQPLIIGALMPIAAVGYYALAIGLTQQIGGVLNPVGQVMYPAAAEMHMRDERGALQRLYVDGSRLMLLVVVSVVLVAALWADDFYRLWIGEKYLSGEQFPSVALLLRILLIGTLAGYTSNIAGQILLGTGRVRLLAISLICGAALNLILVVTLIGPYGLIGVAASVAISAVVVNVIGIPLLLQKALGLPVKDLLLGACVRPMVLGLLLAILLMCIRLTGRPNDWPHLLLHGMLAAASVVALVLMVGINTEERQRFVVQPIRRLLGKETLAPKADPR